MNDVFALATPPSKSAICVFRVSGNTCLKKISVLFGGAEKEFNRFYLSSLYCNGVVIEQLLGNSGKKISYKANSDYKEKFIWSMPEAWKNNPEIRWSSGNLKVVVWIQDFKSKEILQSAEFKF